MRFQPETNPADDYQTTPTSCTCATRIELRTTAPCRHMRALIVGAATAAVAASIHNDTRWSQHLNSSRKDRARELRRELRRDWDAA